MATNKQIANVFTSVLESAIFQFILSIFVIIFIFSIMGIGLYFSMIKDELRGEMDLRVNTFVFINIWVLFGIILLIFI